MTVELSVSESSPREEGIVDQIHKGSQTERLTFKGHQLGHWKGRH